MTTNVLNGGNGANTINVIPGSGGMVTTSSSGGPVMTGRWSADGWAVAGLSPGANAAHESGHLMGVNLGRGNDGYTIDAKGRVVPKPGYENSIMGGVPGAKATEADIQRVLDARPLWMKLLNFFSPTGPPSWLVAGYGSPEAYADARQAIAVQMWADSRMPAWMPFAQYDFASSFSTANGQHHRADGAGGAYLVKPGE